ncbi:MAG TPA: DUF6132 family protein [Chryseosolibacter sp.]|nr:DUF6132 family protein [Chryseosolibacter sp.]
MKHLKWIMGTIAGATIGFVYWYFIGCNSGACAITSSPTNSTIYGGLMGILLINSFAGNGKESRSNKLSQRPSQPK